MKLSFEALRTVSAVVHEGGVNRAAKSLNKVPSAISHTIQKLESELNAKLFVKRGRSLVLTAAHCIYDDVSGTFARNVLFVPNQDATTQKAGPHQQEERFPTHG